MATAAAAVALVDGWPGWIAASTAFLARHPVATALLAAAAAAVLGFIYTSVLAVRTLSVTARCAAAAMQLQSKAETAEKRVKAIAEVAAEAASASACPHRPLLASASTASLGRTKALVSRGSESAHTGQAEGSSLLTRAFTEAGRDSRVTQQDAAFPWITVTELLSTLQMDASDFATLPAAAAARSFARSGGACGRSSCSSLHGPSATRAIGKAVLVVPGNSDEGSFQGGGRSDNSTVSVLRSWRNRATTLDMRPPHPDIWPQKPVLLRAIAEPWMLEELRQQRRPSNAAAQATFANRAVPSDMPVTIGCEAAEAFPTPISSSSLSASLSPRAHRQRILVCCVGVGGMADCGAGASKGATMRVLVQGRFLHPWRLGEVLTGQVFSRPLQHLPPRWVISLGVQVEDIVSDEPFFLSPLVCLAEKLHVAHAPGEACTGERHVQAPSLQNLEVPEDSRLLFGHDRCLPALSVAERKKKLLNKGLLRAIRFNCNNIYTFEFTQSFFLPSTYEFDLGLFRKSLAPLLNKQPVELMALIDPVAIGPPEGLPSVIASREASVAAAQAAAAMEAKNEQHDQVLEVLLPKKPSDRMYAWRFQLLHEQLYTDSPSKLSSSNRSSTYSNTY
ncbi:hypothetical protein cyc_03209 [Cyclospora cayetanensis]|uniref:Domain of unknown function at the cortex 1 domain-containing protein n=1 Tax=Cyclospora cayetanensis TaxID=88456 RepID=A0A1D3D7C6_9EIME|nr:hypothetical protein cyc_03209 [Cyclospora cayetanensis]